MYKILCSTGALVGLANNRNYKILEDVSKHLTCDGFEFMMYASWYEKSDEVVRDLKAMELYIPVMHCEKRMGEEICKGNFKDAYQLFEINCRMARELGADRMVIHLWDGLTSDLYFQNNIKGYEELARIAAGYGVTLLVENVVCNNEDPLKHWCELADIYPNIRFVYDTKMAAFHGQTDLLYEEAYAWLWREGHICHYHVNDYAGGYKEWSKLRTYPIGQGQIDFQRFFEYIKGIRYQGTFTVEGSGLQQDGTVNTDILNRQFDFIRRAMNDILIL